MLKWPLSFLVIALVAGALGLTGVAGVSAEIAKVLFIVFLGLFVISLVGGFALGDRLLHRGTHHLRHH